MSSALVIQHGDLTIDMANYRVLLGRTPVALTYREYALLVYLASHAGHAVSKRRLLEEGLGRHDYGGLRAVEELIRTLKGKLERDGRLLIVEDSPAEGYRFTPPHAFA